MDLRRNVWSRLTGRTRGGARSVALSDSGAQQQTLAGLRTLLESCPVCQQGLSQHSYALVAMAVFNRSIAKSAFDLLSDLSRHHWGEIVSYRDWDGSADNVVVFALRCSSGRIALLVVEDPYELAYDDRLISCDVLDLEDSEGLESVIPEKEWRLIT